MGEAMINDSDTEISTSSSWTVLDDASGGEEEDDGVAPDTVTNGERVAKGCYEDGVVIVGGGAEKGSSAIVDVSSSSSTIRDFLLDADGCRREGGFLSLDEMIEERLIEHDYEYDERREYYEELARKAERKRKQKREKNKGQFIGTLSVVGTVLAMTGISFICMLVPNGSVAPPDVERKLGNVTNFVKVDEGLYGECPVYYNAKAEKLTVTNVSKFVERCQDDAKTKPFDGKPKVSDFGPRQHDHVSFDNFLKANLFEAPSFKVNAPSSRNSSNDVFVFTGEKAIPNATSSDVASAVLPKRTLVHHRSVKNVTKEQTRREKTARNLNAGAVACNMLQDMLLLKMTRRLRRKSEKRIKRLKHHPSVDSSGEASEPAQPEEEAHPSISYVNEVQTKARPSNERAALFTVLPFGKEAAKDPRPQDAEERKILTAKRKTPSILDEESESRPETGLRAKLMKFECPRRATSIENYKRQNRANFEELKKIRLEYEDQIKNGAGGGSSADTLHRLRKAREKYIEHLKRSQEEFVKQIRLRREEENEKLRELVKGRQERQQKDASSGYYEIPVFDSHETRKRLKELKAKEDKLCDLVYSTLPQSCFNDVFDCECQFNPLAAKTNSSGSLQNLSQLEIALDNAQRVAENYHQWTLKWKKKARCDLQDEHNKPGEWGCAASKSPAKGLEGCPKDLGDKMRRQQMTYVDKICRQTHKYWDLKRKYLEKRTSVLTNADIIMKNMINNYKNSKCSRKMVQQEIARNPQSEHVTKILDNIINKALGKTDLQVKAPAKDLALAVDQEKPTCSANTTNGVPKGLRRDDGKKALALARPDRSDPDAMYRWLFGKQGPEIRRKERMLWYLQRLPRQSRLYAVTKQDPKTASKEKNVRKHFAR